MHPALSVVFFTTISGAGYGLWIWLGLWLAGGQPLSRWTALFALALGLVLVSAGLLSSTLHLGKPWRAWRAFSQWRSSWLSREGIVSLACFIPALACAWALWRGEPSRVAGLLLSLLSLSTVACTAMIYASLKPIPAWRHPLVLPLYLLFALFTGGLLMAALFAASGAPLGHWSGFAAMLGASALWRLKRITWRAIDADALPVSRNSALGLPANRSVKVFERPHTEANYLLREMGYILARKHSTKLRLLSLVLFALLPVLCSLPVWFLPQVDPTPWMSAAALTALAGTFIERWLFFAQARHLVTLYY